MAPGALRVKSRDRRARPARRSRPRTSAGPARSSTAHRDPKAKPPTFLETVQAFKVLDVEAREGQAASRSRSRSSPWATRSPGSRCPARSSSSWAWRSSRTRRSRTRSSPSWPTASIGYIPSRRAYTQGNYEVVGARCAEGSGEMLVDAAVRLLKELHAASPATPASSGRRPG